ncbi:MAG: hypothetical protein N3B68_01290 [Anaerolineae bacterium]|nr:hypothetical protein [Anaerolineae bacterium]
MSNIRGIFQKGLTPKATDPEKARREYILNIVLLGLAVPSLLYGLASLAIWLIRGGPWAGAAAGIGVQAFYVLAYWLNRKGHHQAAAFIVLGALVLVMLAGGLQVGIGHSTMVGYAIIVAVAGLLAGFRAALLLTLICGGSYALTGWMQISGWVPAALPPEKTLTVDLAGIVLGLVSLAMILWVAESQLRRALYRERHLSTELRQAVLTLEQRSADLAQRTAELSRRTSQLQAAADVARRAAEIRDVETLLKETVRLISDRFGFYHAGIFLIDEAGEYVILRAASSECG